jgi:chromate transporter
MSETISKAPAPPPPVSSPPVPTLLELCAAFAIIALCGFGGVLAWSRRMLVEERGWMTPEEFDDAYALCQFLPGPNVVNLSVVFGRRIRGAVGSAVALLGLLGPPFVIVTVIGLIYAQFGEIAALQRMLMGVAAAAVGLVMGTCAKMALPLFKDPLGIAPLLALATLVSVGVLRWPLYWALGGLIPLSIAIAWVRR